MRKLSPIPELFQASPYGLQLKRFTFAILFIHLFILFSCKKNETPAENITTNKSDVPEDIVKKLQDAGFDTSEGLRMFKDGYLVEYDIYLTEDQISSLAASKKTSSKTNTPGISHYVANNLVSITAGSIREIKVYMDPGFGTYMQNSFDAALSRYNAVGTNLTFSRVTNSSEAEIQIISFYEVSQTLGISGGFPTGGNPAGTIMLNTYYYNNSTMRTDATTTIAHEIGHAIGFRHTDYMNRTFSCGYGGDEGQAGVGATHVPGTPTSPSAGSWMLACSSNTDRPFTNEDITALKTTYPKPGIIWTMREGTVPFFADNNFVITVNGVTKLENFANAQGIFSDCANGDVITVSQWFQTSIYPWPASGALSRLTVKVDGVAVYDSETDGPTGKSFSFTKEAGKVYEVISTSTNKAVKIVWSNTENTNPYADSNFNINVNGSTSFIEWGTNSGVFTDALAGSTVTFYQFYVLPDYQWPNGTKAQLVVKEDGIIINSNSAAYNTQTERSFSIVLKPEKTYEVSARTFF